jgi:replicative DNA helicase
MTAATATPDQNRAPRHNIEAEANILGAMMLSRDAIAEVSDIIKTSDYYRPIHGTIHNAICHQYNAGEPTDAGAVATRLLATGDLNRIGGATYLHDLVADLPLAANATWYARKIAEEAGFRRLTELAHKLARIAETQSYTLTEAQDVAGQALLEATSGLQRNDVVRFRDLIQPAFDAIEAAGKRKGLRGLSTGLIDLDRMTHGMQPGQLWVIAARPGMGKTVAASDVARAVAIRQNRPVLFFTLEMDRDELMLRWTSAETGVPLTRLQDGSVSDGDWTRLARRIGEIEDAPLWTGDGSETNLMQIRATARRIAAREGDLGLIIVDYLQLMPSVKSGRADQNRQQEVADLSRGLKLLAKEMRVPVVALSQLNRGVEMRADKRPMLSDLRESGAVEQDADIAILLYRPEYYEKDKCARKGEVEWIVAKNRNGQAGTVTAAAQLHLSRFVDMHPDAAA